MKTILGAYYGLSSDREDEIKKIIDQMFDQMSDNIDKKIITFNDFLTELENNETLSIREKFYIIARTTIETLEINKRLHKKEE